jgi:glycosyltransferase involved in cell wall biosynthesis
MLARLKGAPFLFEVRDLWPYFAIDVGVLRQPIIIRLSEWLEQFLYKRADSLVINSPGFMEHVSSRGGECVFIVPNGVDVAMFDQTIDRDSFRSEHHLQDKFVLIYAGAHGVSNDLGTILDAAEILKDELSICFVLLGDGKEKDALQERARQLSLNNVLFLPPVPKKEIPGALAGADACVAILKPIEAYKTTYPNKVFDYMAAGKPVLLMIDGVIREVVEGADAGIFIEPGDADGLAVAVQELKANPALGDRLGGAGKRCVEERFDRAYLAGEMERVMMTLVESESAESSQQDRDGELG